MFNEGVVRKMTLEQLIGLPAIEKMQLINVFGNLMQIFNNGAELFQLFDFFVLVEGLTEEELTFSWALRPMKVEYGIEVNYGIDLFMQN